MATDRAADPPPRSRFIGEQIEVRHHHSPTYSKRPGAPDRFTWEGREYQIADVTMAWHDYARRGRMAQNMRDTHLRAARARGSWGVGRDYFRVRTASGEVFELYYDRAPKGPDRPEGAWFLLRQLLSGDQTA
jgi:hypothetical protein